MMRRVALTAAVVVEQYDAEGSLVQASQPQQVQVAVMRPAALKRALGELAEMIAAQAWPDEAAEPKEATTDGG